MIFTQITKAQKSLKKLLFSRSKRYEVKFIFSEFSEIWVQSKNDFHFLSKYIRTKKAILIEPFFNKYSANYKRQRVYGKHTQKYLLFWGCNESS